MGCAHPNVLVLTASNISEAIDVAFIDRADIKQFIGNPLERARYFILASCLNELLRKGVLYGDEDNNKVHNAKGDGEGPKLLVYEKLRAMGNDNGNVNVNMKVSASSNVRECVFDEKQSPIPFRGDLKVKESEEESEEESASELYWSECSRKLLSIVKLVDGFSGRSLRKLPFVTSVHHIDTPSGTVSVKYFLGRLEEMARIEMKQRKKLKPNKK